MKTNYLVLGATGGLGFAVASALLQREISTTVMVRNYEKAQAAFGSYPQLDIVVGDASDAELLKKVCRDKTHIFHGLNVSYEKWEKEMPVLTQSVIDAASQNEATVVFPGNNYNHGLIKEPITEITPFCPVSNLGKVRVEIEHLLKKAAAQGSINSLVIRLPEVWGPGVVNKSFDPIFSKAIEGKTIPWLYTIDVPQQMAYNMDAGRAIVELSMKGKNGHSVVNYAGEIHNSMRDFFERICEVSLKPMKTTVAGKRLINLLSYINPAMNALKTLSYKYENTIVLSDVKFKKTLPDFQPTPTAKAIRETVDWFAEKRVEPAKTEKKKSRKSAVVDFVADNLSIGLFPLIIAALTMAFPAIKSFAVLIGVVAGIYWSPFIRTVFRKLFSIKKAAMVAVTLLLLSAGKSIAQTGNVPRWAERQTEIGIGISMPKLNSGNALLAAQSIREQGKSYYQSSTGEPRDVGSYSSLIGWGFQFSFYNPHKKVERLMLGASVRGNLTSSRPSDGGYAESYFFNYILTGMAWKYYPFENEKWVLHGDLGLASVMTKNRFLNSSSKQEYFHQFGIGLGGGLGISRELKQLKNGNHLAMDLYYQQMSTRVEVNGLGDDNWSFGSFSLMLTYNF